MGDNMLRKFTVDNYKNFKDPITLDFTKKHDYQFNEYCIKDGLISKMVIFGENGSGKSNLGFALFDIVAVLTDNEKDVITDATSFLCADTNKRVATFTYEFQFGNTIVEYCYKKSKPEKTWRLMEFRQSNIHGIATTLFSAQALQHRHLTSKTNPIIYRSFALSTTIRC